MTVRFSVYTVLILSAHLMTLGCQSESEAPKDTSAEIPTAAPDPGPAPDGQWEPPVETEVGSPDEAQETPTETDESTTDSDSSSEPEEVKLELQTWDETRALIESHKGKVVVVDFWATSCLPCRREFPHLVELQKTFGDQIACVSVSLDYSGRKSRPPETYKDLVLEFLVEQNATFDNVLSTDDPDDLQKELDLPPIPLVWVYNQAGERVETFHNADRGGKEFTYSEHVEPFVRSLLDEF